MSHKENQIPLSKKEKEILEYIINRSENSVPPSVREICTALGYKSTSTAHKYIALLESKGYLQKEIGKNRSIKLCRDNFVQVPLVGNVAAGNPILAVEEIEDFIPIKTRYSAKELFALKVQGESMIEIGILPDDIIIAKKCSVAENGEIVVAMIDESATVKRFFKENNRFRLQPENSSMQPIFTEKVVILGKVISVFRTYENI